MLDNVVEITFTYRIYVAMEILMFERKNRKSVISSAIVIQKSYVNQPKKYILSLE